MPPLLGGFIFVSLWYPLRYWAQREGNYKFVFAASVAGGVFLLGAHLLLSYFGNVRYVAEALAWWDATIPVGDSATAVLGFSLGALLWLPLNLLAVVIRPWRRTNVIRRQILRAGDPFEITLFELLQTQKLVAVTLESGKVYVGRVTMSVNPARQVESVRLRLVLGGYREPVTHALHPNVDYAKTHAEMGERIEALYEEAVDDLLRARLDAREEEVARLAYQRVSDLPEMDTLARNFEVVLMAREVVSLSPFEPDIFEGYFRAKEDWRGHSGQKLRFGS